MTPTRPRSGGIPAADRGWHGGCFLSPPEVMAIRARRALRYERGFTLVEMMTVVILVGILATLAVYGVRKYILSAKTSEAAGMMTTIKGAEEAFKGETFIYLDVSNAFNSDANFYPDFTGVSQGGKVQWGAPSAIATKWKTLGVQPDGPVAFRYAVVATGPGSSQPTLPTGKKDFNLPSTVANWQYVAVAKADLGARPGVFTWVLSHSYSNELYVENEGE